MSSFTISNSANNQRQIAQALRAMSIGNADISLTKQARILSIGNSRIGTHTTTLPNNVALPRMMSLFCQGLIQQVTWDDVTTFGISLRDHWNMGTGSGTARAAIRSKAYTHVILQDLSSNPVSNISDFYQNHRDFRDEILLYSGAKILLLQNWALSDDGNFATTLITLENSYRTIAEEIGAEIIPCGRAWSAARQTISLYKFGDTAHPAIRGIYLNCGCVFQTIFKTNPNISTTYIPEGLTASDTLALNNFAWGAYTEKPYTAITVTEVNVNTGRNLGKFRRIDIWLSSINWNNGSANVTSINDKNDPNSFNQYPTLPNNCHYIYQPGNTAAQVRIITSTDFTKPNTFFVNPAIDTFLGCNDGNYSNNTGFFVANIITYN